MTSPTTEALPKNAMQARMWIVDRVLEISAENHTTPVKAREILHKEMQKHASLWWRLMGDRLIAEVFREGIRSGGNGKRIHRGGVAPHPSALVEGEDWRTQAGNISVWDRMVALGNTGIVKRYGDLTRSDLLVISTFYERQATTMRRKASLFREAAMCVPEGQTLQSVEDQLPPRIMAFVHDQTEPKAEEPEARKGEEAA